MTLAAIRLFLLAAFLLLGVVAVNAHENSKPEWKGVGVGIGYDGTKLKRNKQLHQYVPLNIAWKIGKELDAIGPAPAHRLDTTLVEQKLRSLLSDKSVVCKLVLKPNGQIKTVSILESSGSGKVDNRALDIVRNSGPYANNPMTKEDLSFRVAFPQLEIRCTSL